MMPDTYEAICLAIDAAKADRSSREMSLVITKLEEAQLWCLRSQELDKERVKHTGS